jgi:hypothetical protein
MARFNCAKWMPVQNHGGPMSSNIGLILHHAVANGSLYNWFNDPQSQVSAHFWVSKTGEIEQYVDSEVTAWHAMQMNATYCGVETEGCATAPYAEPMTTAMIDALATLYREGASRHGWPNALADTDGQHGFGYHRMGVPTACPCDVRVNARATILSKAFSTIPPPKPVPVPPYPLPSGYYYGPKSGPVQSVSGYYPPYGGPNGAPGLKQWQAQMLHRGWSINTDGFYTGPTPTVTEQFQAEKGLGVDGLIGPQTWGAAWTTPIT